MNRSEKFAYTILCIDHVSLHADNYKHLGAELDAGRLLAGKDYEDFQNNIKAAIVNYSGDAATDEQAFAAALEELKADLRTYIKNVAKCEVHFEDWEFSFRGTEVTNGRFWLRPCGTRAGGTLAV